MKILSDPNKSYKLLKTLNDANLSSHLLSLAITIIFISYWHHLEISNCACGIGNEEAYIKYSLYVIVLLNIIGLFAPDFILQNNDSFIGKFIIIALVIWAITYYISLGDWLYRMHKNKCKCADDWRKTLMEIIYVFWIIIFIALIFIIMKLH